MKALPLILGGLSLFGLGGLAYLTLSDAKAAPGVDPRIAAAAAAAAKQKKDAAAAAQAAAAKQQQADAAAAKARQDAANATTAAQAKAAADALAKAQRDQQAAADAAAQAAREHADAAARQQAADAMAQRQAADAAAAEALRQAGKVTDPDTMAPEGTTAMVTAPSGLNLRVTHSAASAKLATLPQGTVVTIYKFAAFPPDNDAPKGWAWIIYNDLSGFVSSEWLKLNAPGGAAPATQAQQTTTVTSSNGVNFRSTPSATGTKIGAIAMGATVVVLNMQAAGPDKDAPQGWAQISYNGQTGYVTRAGLR